MRTNIFCQGFPYVTGVKVYVVRDYKSMPNTQIHSVASE